MRFVVYGAGAIGGVVGGRLAQTRPRRGADRARRPPRRDTRRWAAPGRTRRGDGGAVDPGGVAPGGHRLPRRRRRAAGDEEPAHGQGVERAGGDRAADRRRRRGAERRGQRARGAAAVRGRVRRVRGVSRPAPGAGCGRGPRRAGHRHPRHRPVSGWGRRARGGDRRRRSARRRSSRWRAPTSCGGSTASCSTTSATRSTRCVDRIPTRVRCSSGHGTRARPASLPPGSTRSPRRRTPSAAATGSSGVATRRVPARAASSWQSLARGTGSIEADYLNGEIVFLGRLHGVPTPVNLLLQRTAAQAAREGRAAGSMTVEELIQMVAVGE